MTNQPDAYTLAAQAAADRARAEALQRGGAQPGPGLQSPMRRLSRNPAARWVLSGIVLAAGTALAVDYVNGPLGAWMKYHWPIPGSGGKSGAEVAAAQSAAAQAKIDAEIIQPAQAVAGAIAAANETARLDNTKSHIDYSNTVVLTHPTLVKVIGTADNLQVYLEEGTEELHHLENLAYAANHSHPLDPDNLEKVVLPSGEKLARYLYKDDQTPAQTDGGAVLLLLNDKVIVMPRADYDKATVVKGRPPVTVDPS